MGFNKKYITKETIELQIKNNKSIKDLFKSDSFIFLDETSQKVYNLFCEGLDEKDITLWFNEEKK